MRDFALCMGLAAVATAIVIACFCVGQDWEAEREAGARSGRSQMAEARGEKLEVARPRVWNTVASWYARPGDRWSRRYPAAWYLGWPFRVGEFVSGVAFNGLPLFSLVRITAENGRQMVGVVVDRIGRENPEDVRRRIDLTYAGFAMLASPRTGVVAVRVEEIRDRRKE